MKKFFYVVIVVLFAISLSGCNKANDIPTAVGDTEQPTTSATVTPTLDKTTSEPTIQPMPEPTIESKQPSDITSEPITESSAAKPWMEAFRLVLLDSVEFYSTDMQKNIDLPQANDFIEKDVYIKKFAVIDLDNDGIPEVILWQSLSEDNDVGFEIFRYNEGTVYGYSFTYRMFGELKADGTFTSGDAWDWGFGTIRFTESTWYFDRIAYYSSSVNPENDNITLSYFINEENVVEAMFNTACDEQSKKPDAVWYEFTNDNITAAMSIEPER